MTTDHLYEKNKLKVYERFFTNGKRYFCVYYNNKLLLMTTNRRNAFQFVDRRDPDING